MSEKRVTVAHRGAEVVDNATIYNGDTYGLVLGDLRKLIVSAEGMPDDAEVTLDRDGLKAHYSQLDTLTTKRMTVTSRAKAERP